MSYEHLNSGDWLEQYRARQAARNEMMARAIEEGRTHVVIAGEDAEAMSSGQTSEIAPVPKQDK
ncbi:hypothetical protein [Atlantibacter subterraneus]|uniref:Uncharacterized protein n=1 Tax=Atlantibacter subterraneus TaxID=255519 RepID=A0ABU4E0I4_9ENTR|nr:hypothetical protein [Atlantibacter subterranea]MDV7022623.1 hypothetical protein [Atlantibacter subterranea]MDW2742704.1 hypothetical protein [Atlantibacter subterranea]MDZ5665821.1 hypothetical protein [Atlantibacter hermannii]QFH69874.1 hypothetical protein FR762_09065 [Enterobacter sp. E76]